MNQWRGEINVLDTKGRFIATCRTCNERVPMGVKSEEFRRDGDEVVCVIILDSIDADAHALTHTKAARE